MLARKRMSNPNTTTTLINTVFNLRLMGESFTSANFDTTVLFVFMQVAPGLGAIGCSRQ